LPSLSGSFSLVVRDASDERRPLFDYDVGVSCPTSFSVDLVVPTAASRRDDVDRTMLVSVVDSYRTIRLTVFRPARNLTTTATFGTFGVPFASPESEGIFD